ncbi:DNA-formamidopyrimidine glycosylase [Candidatus Roizmanbacteria bacterium CG2_30_33_16]|uniref:DNA-formamidopyrimidine glycosylase n=2 Tax=Candidatus Roizmaniibacteriota TaxID=1752723 RepID=A0A2M8DC11_9BACT|nr:MAG: DNA-formamidopyrimidine glycosylase [Candidatus Roizmanbacteria bacterium CG2_30_33_16]PJB87948.1 MAG: hypothetical protein CO083_04360 [Candidatus Roizmanbacteria bacterium CG_4_9_14_0_8_um_filter_34_12]
MPELPEVESIRTYLISHIIGKTISNIQVIEKKQFIGDIKITLNQKIIELSRKGKYLAIKLENDYYLNIHLKMSGQFLYSKDKKHTKFPTIIPFTKSQQMPGSTTRIIINFTDQSKLFYNDLRKFGYIKVSKITEFPKSPDILSNPFTKKYLIDVLKHSSQPIKIILLDQNKMAGIGNIYANEILFQSKIHPLQPSNSLTSKQINILYLVINKIISKAISYQGTSASDESFILPNSNKGSYQKYLHVYDRENQPCKECQSNIQRIKHHGRSSYFCPMCQKFN